MKIIGIEWTDGTLFATIFKYEINYYKEAKIWHL